MDEARGNIDREATREAVAATREAYAHLAREIDRQIFGPLRRMSKTFMERYGDQEIEFHGVTMPLRDAVACLNDQALHGEAFVMRDADGRGHRVAPEMIQVIR